MMGSLALAAQLFREDGRNVLIVFSDTRHYTAALDLEHPQTIRAAQAIEVVEKQRLIPNLKNVQVYVLGADAAGKPIGDWQDWWDFWVAYFQKASRLESYSLRRELLAPQ